MLEIGGKDYLGSGLHGDISFFRPAPSNCRVGRGVDPGTNSGG